jgi:hypothetical protein
MRGVLTSQNQLVNFDLNKIFASPSNIKNDFLRIWNKINKLCDLNISFNFKELENLVIYDILDGTRSTLSMNNMFDHRLECAFFTLNLIHTLKSLGVKSSYFMVHTSYNRNRGEKEFKLVLEKILLGAPFVKKYAIQNNIRCLCIGANENYELRDVLKEVMESTRDGSFNAFFLFDYAEYLPQSDEKQNVFDVLPDIDVCIRHTKFQISGGWIPGKMRRSVFLYSQNGTTYSNWESDEIVALIAMSLFAKKINEGEGLSKIYSDNDELKQRYIKREIDLFHKTVYFREKPRKLFMLGSPIGIYQMYY